MEAKKEANAPKWGTKEWLAAYPYSTMDRKRRARAKKAVGPEFMEEFTEGPRTCCLLDKLDKLMTKYGVGFAKADRAKFEKALVAVSDYEAVVYDAVFAAKLAQVWGLEV
jgi:hypothetical protein